MAITSPDTMFHRPARPCCRRFRSAAFMAVIFVFLSSPRAAGQDQNSPVAARGDDPTTLQLTPQTIEMGAFYNGAPIRMEGTIPKGSQVIVIIRGATKDEVFNKKGRVGPIWINVDKVHVTGTPSLFLRFSSEDMHTFLDRKTIDAYELDELSVTERMRIRTSHGEPSAEYRELIQNSYLELKKKDGTYRRVANRVHMAEVNGVTHYMLLFNWPKTAPPGSYQVELYACRDRAIVGRSGTVLRLVEVGFPAFIANLAHQHPWEYGVVAVVVAVLAGFGIDAVASRLRPKRAPRPAKILAPAAAPPQVAERTEHEHETVPHH